jgi:hypothetical protein
MIVACGQALVNVSLDESVKVREAQQGASLLSGTFGGTFKDMDRAGNEAAEITLMEVLAARHGYVVSRDAADSYGSMPTSKGDRMPMVPPSALYREIPREFVRGSDTDDLVPTAGRIIDLYA